MKQLPRNDIAVIKDILYPEKKNNGKLWQKKNIENLRIQEEKNRRLKEEKENFIQPELYKLSQFKNVQSKLQQNTQDWIKHERENLKNNNNNKINYNLFQRKRPNSIKIKINSKTKDENIYNIDNNKKVSLFDQYYSHQSKSPSFNNLRPISQQNSFGINDCNTIENNISNRNKIKSDLNLDDLNDEELNQLLKDYNEYVSQKNSIQETKPHINNINNMNNNINNNINYPPQNIYPDIPQENIYNNSPQIPNINEMNYPEKNIENQNPLSINVKNSKDAEIEQMVKDYTSKYGYDETIQQLIKEYNSKGKIELNSIPEADENLEQTLKKPKSNINNNNKQLVLPKIQKNFIKDNRKIISEGKVHQRTKPKENPQPILHKDYGKTPLYIKKYEIENELKKEEIKRKEEEAKIPPGTKLLSEEERLSTLNGLLNSKKEITNLLEKMPITTRTIAVQNRKDELIKKLDEIEKAIEMFSKKQVFIKI